LLGPALRRGVVPDFSGCCARLGDIISNLFVRYKGAGFYRADFVWDPKSIPFMIWCWNSVNTITVRPPHAFFRSDQI
jgi:hypothetical protein